MTPGYSWRSSNIPKRLTQTKPTFIPTSQRSSNRGWWALLLVVSIVGLGFYADRFHRKEFRRTVNKIDKLLR